MMKIAKIVLLILLVPYVIWIVGQDRFQPRALFDGLVVGAVVLPLIMARIAHGRWRSTVLSLVVTPTVLCIALYVSALGDREALAWFPIIAAWLLAVTGPVWITVSVVFGAMKDRLEKLKAEPSPPPYVSPAAGSPSGEA